jgi:hypothetical protein
LLLLGGVLAGVDADVVVVIIVVTERIVGA